MTPPNVQHWLDKLNLHTTLHLSQLAGSPVMFGTVTPTETELIDARIIMRQEAYYVARLTEAIANPDPPKKKRFFRRK